MEFAYDEFLDMFQLTKDIGYKTPLDTTLYRTVRDVVGIYNALSVFNTGFGRETIFLEEIRNIDGI